ncbi:SAM-dependent methyltransferase [Helicobacter felis]|uniref:SAM-dependent methyltransferase n=1 Tax=Helicobacter felis TaxID=214 RepID=UPI000CF150AE|nr:SAM-dependent methyltransferase [Helicobacter felis]
MSRPFSDFMHAWLYGDGGYYKKARIGTQGDFYTSVSTSKFFGGTLAFYLLGLLEKGLLTLPLSVVEMGAHGGELLGDVLSFLRALSQGVLEQVEFVSVEPLEELRALQQKRLAQMGSNLRCVASPLDLNIPPTQSVFIYNNELWDSFPCELVRPGAQLFVDTHFKPFWHEASYTQEGCMPHWEACISALLNALEKAKSWVLVSFDYGQYGPRNAIDLRGYFQHRVFDFEEILSNLNELYQKIDLTYDVDFQRLESLINQQGAHTLFYGTQSLALVRMGLPQLLELFGAHMPFSIYQKEAFKARALLDPSALGERFKALISASFTTT